MSESNQTHQDQFQLYDLRVELVEIRGQSFTYNAKIGDYFEVRGENIYLPEGQGFSMYNLASIIPLLPAKQRENHPNDWMETDSFIHSVDANCGAIFEIKRIRKNVFRHSETSSNPKENY
jgi:uncharacterized repeat protein (TIGR04076 family)